MSDLYEADILLWSQRPLLRRVAAREPVNEAPDWPNIIEEIESVGSEQLHAVESVLLQALVDRLKAEAWPLSGEVPQWQAEARVFLSQAANRYAPSMRQRLDLGRICRQAVRGLPGTIDGEPPLPLPSPYPASLDALLDAGLAL